MSLAPVDFSGALFTHAHFQKIAQISILCKEFLVTNDLSAADLVHADFFKT